METSELEQSLAEYAKETAKDREQLETEIANLRRRERRAKGALKAFNPNHPLLSRNGSRRNNGRKSLGGSVRTSNMERVAAWVIKQEGEFTVADAIQGSGVTEGSVRRAIHLLRQSEGILFSSSRRPSTGSSRKAEHFKFVDLDGVEEAKRKNEAMNNA